MSTEKNPIAADSTMTGKVPVQNLSIFSVPPGFRGRNVFVVQLWWLIQATLFSKSPRFANKFRASVLRIFGAKVGKNTVIRPTVEVTYPWKVVIGNNVQIGDHVVLYSLGEIVIGDNSVVSQKSYLCAGDHDYKDVGFRIRSNPIRIGKECWIATDCFLAPGVSIGDGAVIGARSSVFGDMPSYWVCMGSPCTPRKSRFI